MHDEKDSKKIINLNDARRTIDHKSRKGAASGKSAKMGPGDGYKKAMNSQKSRGSTGSGPIKWYHYVQTLGLLLLVALLMKSCGG